jgi:toxin-antitoxin system PIN domain toxin
VTYLLDSNVLIALTVEDHVHHVAAARWWTDKDDPFATCPITQGAFLRLLIREGLASTFAAQVLGQITAHPRHIFWAHVISYDTTDLACLLGHAHVTDTYPVALARHQGARLATLDRDLALAASDAATLIPLD